jgi:hypothetical protein
MNSTKLASIGFAAALTAILAVIPAQAQVTRTFVSASGSDSNNCANVATPCRHFAAAFAATAINGEIYVLDPANYGSLTINHAVSIQGHGWGSIAPVIGGNGITINAPSTDAVNLDGLTIDGTSLAANGIVFNSGRSLTVENCVVRNMGGMGFGLIFLSTATTAQKLSVSNSYFTDNSIAGMSIVTQSSGAVTATIDRTVFDGNGGTGLFVSGSSGTGPLSVAVTDSVAANGGNGFTVQSFTSQSVTNLALTRSQSVGNSINGLMASGANATLWLAQSTVTGNAASFSINPGGAINSYGDNYLAAANGAPTGSLTPATKQ